jgi:hypothetical protein
MSLRRYVRSGPDWGIPGWTEKTSNPGSNPRCPSRQSTRFPFIYLFFLLIKNKNNNKYTPGWMDWIEIPLHEFAGFLANSTLAHRRGVNGLLSKFHHTIPIFRYKLLFQSMLPMKKAGWTGFGGLPTLQL